MTRHYLACDLGAESGRLISGTLENGKLSLQEIHRFANTPKRIDASLHWNIPNLILELKEGIRKAARTGLHFQSISTDSWGVDYILFGVAQTLVCPPTSSLNATPADPKSQTPNPGNPVNPVKKPLPSALSAPSALIPPSSSFEILEPIYHYRDPRTKRGVEIAYSRTTWPEIFSQSGIQFMPINTLFQLASEDPARLRSAQFLLGVGDAFNYFLVGGSPKIEVSMASTFQLYNPRTRQWSDKLISALQLPRHIFPEIVPSATRLGQLRPDLAAELGIPQLQVIATCSHDTAAAVAGVPSHSTGGTSSASPTSTRRDSVNLRAQRSASFITSTGGSSLSQQGRGSGEGFDSPKVQAHNLQPTWAYLSSGTWSLMGVELAEPRSEERRVGKEC